MQAVVMHQTGGPEVLRLEQVDLPEPGDGEVLVKVHAASVNPIDWKYRRGLAPKQLPAILGNDVSGTVELSRAEGLAEGAEVVGLGADEYVDYTQQDVAKAVSDVDVAFDTVGGETTQSLLPTVREGGVLVTIAGAAPEQEAAQLGVRAELLIMSPNIDQLARIAELVAAG